SVRVAPFSPLTPMGPTAGYEENPRPVFRFVLPAESAMRYACVKLPLSRGVPEINPEEAIATPVGMNVPGKSENAVGAMPLTAESGKEYDVPTRRGAVLTLCV